MDLVVTTEQRFTRTPDGAVWTPTTFTRSFWARYLAVFDRIRVVARVREAPVADPRWHRADAETVSFAALPHYLGPFQYLVRARRIAATARAALAPKSAVILRVGSPIAAAFDPLLRRSGRPYGVEVVGDPYDVFAPGVVKHPLRPFLRWHLSRSLQRECLEACGAAYVTREALQRRYPCPSFSVGVSDVELPGEALVPAPRPLHRFDTGRIPTLITVTSLAQWYKAPDVLVDAVAACTSEGLALELLLIGDGRHRPDLEARVQALGMSDRIQFLGHLPAGTAVQAQLDRSDLFVLPSRTEGLPRAMIEAMARALPCIGSTVGGIPELLPLEDMVPPGDVGALSRKIREVVSDPVRMARMSSRNLEKAREYREETLRERRTAFYRYLEEKTQAWLRAGDSQ